MKRFLSKLFIYLISFYLLGNYIEYTIDTKLSKVYDDSYGDWNRIFKGEINADIVILGSSRAWVQYNPKIIEKETGLRCYNLGQDGANTLLQKTKWDSYLFNNKKPKVVIQDIDLLMFGGKHKSGKIYDKYRYLPYLENETVSKNLSTIDPFVKMENFIPLIKYNGYGMLLYEIIYKTKPETKYNGYHGQEKSWDSRKFNDFIKKNSELKINNEKYKVGKEILLKLINDCHKNNIELILVHSPMYTKAQNIFIQQKSFKTNISAIAKKFNCHFFDFTNDSINNDTTLFYNATHLNKKGSDIFTHKLSKLLQETLYIN